MLHSTGKYTYYRYEFGQKALGISAFLYFSASPLDLQATEIGGGYGRQFLNNTDIEQYEMLVREPLDYKTVLGKRFLIASDVEIGMAVIREAGVLHSEIAKFSIIPQLVFQSSDRVHYFVGLGSGLMAGVPEFVRHDLGGPFFLASKVGLRVLFGKNWGLECAYYHQSNAGIYEHNASLNMLQLALYSRF